MTTTALKSIMMDLKLGTAAEELSNVLSKHKSNVSLNWIIELLQRELDSKKEKSLQRRIKKAKFPAMKSMEQFDWQFNPNIPKTKIEELQNLQFIKDNSIILFLGQPGTGKTHTAISLGIKAVHEGHGVYWTSMKRLCEDIRSYKERNDLSTLFKRILNSKLWILDDWGVVSLPRDIAEEVFDLLDRRQYSSSMILTSNRDINEWPEVFEDPVVASGAIDRIFDRPNIAVFRGKSYRAQKKDMTKEKACDKKES